MNISLDNQTLADAAPERPMRLSLATTADLDAVMALLTAYFTETPIYSRLTLNLDAARQYRRELIAVGVPHVLALWRGDPVALVSWRYDRTFSVEPVANMGEFYILPQFRRTPLGRTLLNAAIDIARHEGAAIFQAEIASGLAVSTSLKNMFRKHGAQEIGATFLMEL